MTAERRAAAFLFAATAGFAGLVLVSSLDEGWWRPQVEYTATLESGAGLSSGMPVTVSHLPVGRVEQILLESDRRVRLRMSIDQRYAEHVRVDSVADAVLLTSGKVIEVGAGQGPALEPGGELARGENFDPLLTLRDLDLADTLVELQRSLNDLNELAANLALGEGELPVLVQLMSQTLQDLQEGEGLLGVMLNDPRLTAQFNDTLVQTADASEALKVSSEHLDETLTVFTEATLEVGSGAEKINEGMPKVTAGAEELHQAMIETREALERMNGTLDRVDKTLERVEALPTLPVRAREDGAVEKESPPPSP